MTVKATGRKQGLTLYACLYFWRALRHFGIVTSVGLIGCYVLEDGEIDFQETE